MNIPFVDLNSQHSKIRHETDAAIKAVLDRGDYILGKEVAELEEAFAAYCGAPFAVGVDSGYSAIELILRGFGIGEGDEVITVTHTFIASALAISNCGAKPVLVDVDEATYNMNPELVEAKITDKTKAIIAVHLYGQPADMTALQAIARKHKLYLIEDSAQAHGSYCDGKMAGSLGDAAAFSFYPSKNLGAFGDAGIVLTKHADLAENIRTLRNVGQKVRNEHVVRGVNCRLDTLQAAILKTKLPHLEAWNKSRQEAAGFYQEALADLPLILPSVAENRTHVYHLYIVRTKERAALQAHLQTSGVATGIHYPTPVHMQAAYADLGYKQGDFPVSESLAKEILSLPIFPDMSREQVAYVAQAIGDFFKVAA